MLGTYVRPSTIQFGNCRIVLKHICLARRSVFFARTATNPSLGSQWKKGFLSGKSAYSVSRQPSAMVPVETQTQVTIPQAQVQAEESNVSSNAFEGNVVEKSKNTVACLASLRTPLATAGTSPRVSRFKARRQGL